MSELSVRQKLEKETFRNLLVLGLVLGALAVCFLMSRGVGLQKVWWEQSSSTEEPSQTSSSPSKLGAASIGENRSSGTHASASPEADVQLKQAMGLIDQGRWQEAEPLLERLIAAEPTHEGALIELATLKIMERNDHKAGRVLLEKALRLNPNNASALEELVSLYEEGRAWDEGLVFLQSISEPSAAVDYAKGSALLGLGRSDEAIEALQKAIYDGDYREFEARRNLVDALSSVGRYEEALRESEQIVQGPYRLQEVRLGKMQMAHILTEMRRYPEARRMLQTMLDSDPSDKWVGTMLQRLDEAEAAR